MKYDFSLIHSRNNTNCTKWEAVTTIFDCNDLIPMWVADMDFPTARPIVEALQKRAAHQFYGYTHPGASAAEALIDRMQGKFGWTVQPEWIVFTPGVIPAISVAIRSLTHLGDEIILQEPVYYPFFTAVKQSGCQIAINPLKLVGARYEMDFVDLEARFHNRAGMGDTASRSRGVILCNPHNPIGRVWNKDELVRLGEIVIGHEGTVISDEIHCEILFRGVHHVSIASISHDFEQNCIV